MDSTLEDKKFHHFSIHLPSVWSEDTTIEMDGRPLLGVRAITMKAAMGEYNTLIIEVIPESVEVDGVIPTDYTRIITDPA